MKNSDLEVLTIVQQVLRHVMLALAAGSKANLGDVGSVLEAAAANGALDPMARQMLADLAAGVTFLQGTGIRKQ